jgi:hypothetical protein
MGWRAWKGGFVLLGAGCLISCGGGGRELPDPGPDAGVDPSTTLSNATPAEQMQICEWIAGRLGGYGRRVTCSDGDYLSDAASCANLPPDPTDCYHTIGEVESCVNGVVGGARRSPRSVFRYCSTAECRRTPLSTTRRGLYCRPGMT